MPGRRTFSGETQWDKIPWKALNDSQLAKKLRVSRTKVWEMRRIHAPDTQKKWRGHWQDWQGQDWTLRDADIAAARGCSESTVNKARRWLSPEGVKAERKRGSGRRRTVEVDAYDLKLSIKENAANMGCSVVWAGHLRKRKLAIMALKESLT